MFVFPPQVTMMFPAYSQPIYAPSYCPGFPMGDPYEGVPSEFGPTECFVLHTHRFPESPVQYILKIPFPPDSRIPRNPSSPRPALQEIL